MSKSIETNKTERFESVNAVKGMDDLLPLDAANWLALEEELSLWASSYGYQAMRTPILEHTRLFKRGIGEVTDVVEKEMYSFADQSDKYGDNDHLSLRPELTAGLVRAVIEHNMLYNGSMRVFTCGPAFRRERPQKGRRRQFHQFDVEALGFAGPDIDAEMILMLARLWEQLGLENLRLEINCLGSSQERAAHRAALIAYFEAHQDQLDEEAKRRLHSNPLRILDTKNATMFALVEAAPKLLDYLGEDSQKHFDGLQRYLKTAGVQYSVNPRLVRGLDYYNLTAFEWITDDLGAQGTVAGGGRYDGLIEQLGGKSAPAVGFAIGLERLTALLAAHQAPTQAVLCDVYVVHQGENASLRAFHVADDLRVQGLNTMLHCGAGNFKAQMKRADASGAEVAVIIGENELEQGVATVKFLNSDTDSKQIQVGFDVLAETLYQQLYGINIDKTKE